MHGGSRIADCAACDSWPKESSAEVGARSCGLLSGQICAGLCFLLLIVPFENCRAIEQPDGHSPRGPVAKVDIVNDGDLVLVPVTVDKQVYDFVLDTGASIHYFDVRFKALLGPAKRKAIGTSAHGTNSIVLYDSPEASIGDLSIRSAAPVACADFTQLRRFSGHKIYGLLGMSFLKDYVVGLDFDSRKLTLARTLEARPQTPAIALVEHNLMPHVQAQIKGYGKLEFLVDTGRTGSFVGSLRTQDFDRLAASGAMQVLRSDGGPEIPPASPTGFGVTTDIRRIGLVGALTVGGRTLTRRGFVEHAGASNLGLDYLTFYNVVFDFPNHEMYLTPRSKSELLDVGNLSGLVVVSEDGEIVVDSVARGSPGAKAGLKPRDVVLAVDGRDAAEFRLHSLTVLFSSPGLRVRLKLKRGEQVLEKTLWLQAAKKSAQRALPRPGAPSTVFGRRHRSPEGRPHWSHDADVGMFPAASVPPRLLQTIPASVNAPPPTMAGVTASPNSQTPQITVSTGETLPTVATWLASSRRRAWFWNASPKTLTTRVR